MSGNNSLTLISWQTEGMAPSAKKAQISKQKEQLAQGLTPDHKALSTDRRKAPVDLELPTRKTQLHTFLGTAGFAT